MTVDRDMVSSNLRDSRKGFVALSIPLDHPGISYHRRSFASDEIGWGEFIARTLNTGCVCCSWMGISKCRLILLSFCQARGMGKKKGRLLSYDVIIPAVLS
jgi:hypothetical protein